MRRTVFIILALSFLISCNGTKVVTPPKVATTPGVTQPAATPVRARINFRSTLPIGWTKTQDRPLLLANKARGSVIVVFPINTHGENPEDELYRSLDALLTTVPLVLGQKMMTVDRLTVFVPVTVLDASLRGIIAVRRIPREVDTPAETTIICHGKWPPSENDASSKDFHAIVRGFRYEYAEE